MTRRLPQSSFSGHSEHPSSFGFLPKMCLTIPTAAPATTAATIAVWIYSPIIIKKRWANAHLNIIFENFKPRSQL